MNYPVCFMSGHLNYLINVKLFNHLCFVQLRFYAVASAVSTLDGNNILAGFWCPEFYVCDFLYKSSGKV